MDQREAEKMVEELCEDEDANMSGWEVDFIEQMANMVEIDMEFTGKQIAKIQEIWLRRMT